MAISNLLQCMIADQYDGYLDILPKGQWDMLGVFYGQ
jgi:hypothetical protein